MANDFTKWVDGLRVVTGTTCIATMPWPIAGIAIVDVMGSHELPGIGNVVNVDDQPRILASSAAGQHRWVPLPEPPPKKLEGVW